MTKADNPALAELLPCPRCGTRAFVTATTNEVWCVQDGCLRLPSRASRAEAIAAWNQRHTPAQPTADVVEALAVSHAQGFAAGVEAAAKVADDFAESLVPFLGNAEPSLTNDGAWRRVQDGAKDIADAIRALQQPPSPPPAPTINIRAETTDGQLTGSCSLNVVCVEREDDGSFTAVTDYWPSPTSPASVEAVRLKLLQAKAKGEASIAMGVMPNYCDGVEHFMELAWEHRDTILAALHPTSPTVEEAVEHCIEIIRGRCTELTGDRRIDDELRFELNTVETRVRNYARTLNTTEGEAK